MNTSNPPVAVSSPGRQTFGCGEKFWSNVESLIADAAGYGFQKDRANRLEWLLTAACAHGPLRVSRRAVDLRLDFRVDFDPVTQEYILTAEEV